MQYPSYSHKPTQEQRNGELALLVAKLVFMHRNTRKRVNELTERIDQLEQQLAAITVSGAV